MKINSKQHILMTSNDVKDAIIRHLYRNQGISGIFDIDFKIVNKPIGTNPRDYMDHWVFEGAEITVSLNEK